MIYIGCPYRHESPLVRKQRFDVVTRYAAILMQEHKFAYSPISYTHQFDTQFKIPDDFWNDFSLDMLSLASGFHVLCLDGWKQSKGLAMELNWWEAWVNKEPVWLTLHGNSYIVGPKPWH